MGTMGGWEVLPGIVAARTPVSFCMKKHTGWAAIETVNTINERRSKIVKNRVIFCRLSANDNRKYCF